MKSFLHAFSVAVLWTAVQVAGAGSFEFPFSFSPDAVRLHTTPDGEVAVRLEGCKLAPTDPGSPWLPVKEFSFRVPEGETIMDWSVEAGESVLLAEDVLPVFAPRPHKTGGVDEDRYVPATRNEALYGSADPYPATRAELVHSGNMRGVTIASFRVSPIWFVGAERKLYFTPSITVKIVTGVPPKATVAAPDAAFAPPPSRLFEDAIDAMVVNPKNDGLTPRPPEAVPKSGSGCEYLVITKEAFLAPARKLSEFRKAFDGVTSEVVTMEYIKDHYSGSDDAAKLRACIKSYVQTKGTEYVVLAGDDRVVPIREVSVYTDQYTYYTDAPSDLYYSDLDGTWDADGDGVYGERADDELDLYPDVIVGRLPMRTPAQLAAYVDKVIRYEETTMDDSDIVRKVLWFGYTLWDTLVHFESITVGDTTTNDVWCSVNMDYTYDSTLGKYVQGTTNATVYAEKLKYQLPTERHCDGLMEYLDRPFGADGNDAEFWCRRLHEMFFRTNANWRTSFAFGSATSWDREKLADYKLYGDTYSGHANTVQEVLNHGYHFAGLDTHGNYAYVSMGGDETWSNLKGSSSYYAKDAVQLTNRVDIFCTEACITGGFDLDGNASRPAVRKADNAEDPNFAEGFLRAPKGGSVVFVGCAREGYSYPMMESSGMSSGWQDPNHFSAYYFFTDYHAEYSKDFVRGFWRELIQNRTPKVGPAFATSKAEWSGKCTDAYYHWLELLTNLLGDPLLTVHTPPARSQESTRALSEHSMVTLLRDPSLELTSNSAKIHVAADGIILGETAKVELEYSTSSTFSTKSTVTVATNVKNLGEFSQTLTGLNPGTKYYVRGKMTVTPKSGSAATCMSPFTTSFTTLPANSVGGRLTQGGAGVSGVTVQAIDADGNVVASGTTDADGQFRLALWPGWTGSIVPQMPVGKGAFPGSQTVTVPAGGSISADFEVKPIVYVNCRATGKNDGSNWTDAYTSLADAISASPEGMVIWVAEGVYTPDETHGRDSHFAPPEGMQIYGGFAGGETSLSQRDWIAHPTVLSGDIGTKGTATDNCYHVIRWAKGVVLDGVGITGGRMDVQLNSSTYEHGVAIGSPASNPCESRAFSNLSQAAENGYYVVLDHCSVTNNYAKDPRSSSNDNYRYGTLFYNYYVWARNTFIANNELDGTDGAIQSTVLDNCTVTGNKNYCAIVSSSIVRNSIIYGNTKTLSHTNESKTDYSGSYQTYWKNWMVYLGSELNCGGSTRFLTESFLCYAYGENPPSFYPGAANWFRGTAGQNTPGWVTSGSFPYALTADSYAAEKGLVLDWMDETTLDYLGNPRVNGSAPDLGCCEVPSGDNPPPPTPVPPTGTVAPSDVSYTTAKVTATITDLGSETASDVSVNLVVSKNSSYSPTVFNQAVTDGTATSLSGLEPNTKYYVKATFTGANSGFTTSETTFTTLAYSAPTISSVSVGTPTTSSASVTVALGGWGNGSTGGTILVEALLNGTAMASASGTAAGTFTLTGLAAGTTYTVRVTATGSNGLPASDASKTFTTQALTAPTGTVASSAVSYTTATVTATLSSRGDEAKDSDVTIKLVVSKKSDFSTEVFSGTVSTKALTGLEPNTTYYVKAIFEGATAGSSDATTSFRTLAYTAPTISSVSVGSITSSGATVSVAVGGWGDGSDGGTVKVEVLSGSTVVDTKTGSAAGDFAFTGLAPDTTYAVLVTLAGSNGLSATDDTKSFTTPAEPFATLSAATATVATNGVSAVLSVTVEDTNVSGGQLVLTLNGAEVKTWALAKGTFSETVAVTPGSTNVFSFAATGSGVSETANGTFVATVYVGWFDVRFGDAGFVAGADWIAQSVDRSGGTFEASEETESELVKGSDSYVSIGGEVSYTPSHASETGADVKIDGRIQVSQLPAAPEVPAGAKAAICFVDGTPRVYSSAGWVALTGSLAEGTWVDYVFEIDYASESAPRIRYTVGPETSEWLPIVAPTRDVQRMLFRDGSFGDFKAMYVSLGGDEPIELVRPEFATDGTGIGLGSTTFSMTIVNPVKGAYYTVFTATTLTGSFTAEADSELFDSSDATYTLTVEADTPTKFARIVISSTPFKAGDSFPEK